MKILITHCLSILIIAGLYGQCDISVTVANTELCATDASGTAPFTYDWGNGMHTQCISPGTPGMYCVTMTDANGCTASACGDLILNPGAAYYPFPKGNAFWEEGFIGFVGTEQLSNTILCGDTMINGQQLSKAYLIEFDTATGQEINRTYQGGIYEDSDKKVWLTNTNGIMGLLYDFALEVGDTFPPIPEMIVESITTTYVNGEGRRTINFEQTPFGLPREYWIEGIGSSYGMLTRGIYAIDYSPYCKCYSQNGVQLHNFKPSVYTCSFDFSDPACVVASSIEDAVLDNGDIVIYPNPFSDYLQIELTGRKRISR